MTRQVWAREHLASYLAGGLSTEERYEIQELLKTDADLAAAHEELRGVDARLKSLFAGATPSSSLEDRLIRALRQTTPARRASKLSTPAKWMMVAASVMLVVFAGSTAFVVMEEMQSMTPMAADGQSLADRSYFGRVTTRVTTGNAVEFFSFDPAENERLDLSDSMRTNDLTLERHSDKGRLSTMDDTSMTWDEKAKVSLQAPNVTNGYFFGVTDGRKPGQNGGFGGGGGALGGALGGMGGGAPVAGGGDEGSKDLSVLGRSGGGSGPYKAREHWRFEEKSEKASADRLDGTAPQGGSKPRFTMVPRNETSSPPPAEKRPASPQIDPSSNAPTIVAPVVSPPPPVGDATPASPSAPPTKVPLGFDPADGLNKLLGKAGEVDGEKDIRSGTEKNDSIPDLMKRDRGDKSEAGEKEDVKKLEQTRNAAEQVLKDLNVDPKKANADPTKVDPTPEPKIEPKTAPKTPTQRRVIIRSGDIDFEVDSFDQAVDIISKLIAKTQGGVIATTNSDKLANGKMRGTLVVRMPPEELDDFVAGLRQGLGKIGELKNQRIGSQDVTKQYTDMESELRGLRVSEERLIAMLKDTKAQLKDLLAVEKQLADTRTRVERIEGELRYYANLAAMSTLTINLNEKEIRVAAGVIESERVQAGIESEDVDKAYQEARAAIDELKGRVFHSELKQSPGGQFNALLQFDVAPDQSGVMRDRLKQIGVVARLDVDRVQKVEGGGQPNRESKIKKGDAQFFVSIYNLANMEPRETVQMTIIGADVPASYRKIRDVLGKLKSNVWNTSLQNTDPRRIVGVLNFNIRRADEAAILAVLAESGDVLSRKVDRSADRPQVTDTKVRFDITLRSVGSVSARETNNLSVAAIDVPASFRKVRDEVLKVKGHIRDANLTVKDNSSTTATLTFEVMRADEAALLSTLIEAGEVLSREIERRPEGEEVTDTKVGFKVNMVSVASLPARESTTLDIAVVDVAETFQTIRAAVLKAKSQVHQADLREADRQQTDAVLIFDVLRADEDAVKAVLAQAGEKLASQVIRQSAGANVTDAKVKYDVRIVSVNSIEPRSLFGISLQVDDVSDKLKTLSALIKDAQGRVIKGPTSNTDKGTVRARVTYVVPLSQGMQVVDDVRKLGTVVLQDENKDPKAPDGKLALAQIDVTLSSEVVEPRDVHKIAIQTEEVGEKVRVITNLVTAAGGKAVVGPISSSNNGVVKADVVYTLPLASGSVVADEIKKIGKVIIQENKQNLKAPDGKLAVARIEVSLSNSVLVPADEGFWSQVRGGLAISLRGLSLSASILIVAILFIGPWLLLIWAVTWLVRKYFVSAETPDEPGTPALAGGAPSETPKA